MATLNSCYLDFEGIMKQCINYFFLEGKVTLHNDYKNHSIGILFRFTYRYLSIKDIINFYLDEDKKVIMDATIKHLKEIRDQFNYYFNAIWC